MRTPFLVLTGNGTLVRIASRSVLLLVAFAAFVLVPGCPDNTAQDVISGKVTLNEKNVGGTIHFYGPAPDNKEATSAITDGVYSVPNPPLGKCKIKILAEPTLPGTKKVGDAGAVSAKEASGVDKNIGNQTISKGVAPPDKYKNPDNGLTTEVKKGKQTFDIKLTE